MKRCVLLAVVLTLTGCEGTELSVHESSAESSNPVTEIASPAAPGSGEPFLASGSDGSVLMSWLEPAGEAWALRFARYAGAEWSEAVTIEERTDFFVNWADFPSIVETPKGNLVAHWLQKSGDAPYAYDVKLAFSSDGGETWSESATLHDDEVITEHGFVSLVPEGGGEDTVAAIWLDGRKMTGEGHGDGSGAMTLRFARIHPDGSITDRSELDDRVCECCQTSMVQSDGRLVAIYRDRSENEIRDIGIVREQPDGWSEPEIVHADGWEIAACPVNGPQIDAAGENVVIAWYTAASEEDRVHAAFSTDGGTTFGERIRIDAGEALGRVDTVLLDDGRAIVVWLASAGGEGRILARSVDREGRLSSVKTLGRSASSRASGFPRMTVADRHVLVAWTEPGERARVRVVKIDPEEIS
ncbi:MAG: sialidase family protein [Thermoanaerobaculia bacterium]|nr:sialidase family protein [Thermoanaerobaculia bacterium]